MGPQTQLIPTYLQDGKDSDQRNTLTELLLACLSWKPERAILNSIASFYENEHSGLKAPRLAISDPPARCAPHPTL